MTIALLDHKSIPAYLGIEFETSSQWKDVLVAIAAALDRSDDVDALLAEYEQRARRVSTDSCPHSFWPQERPDFVPLLGPELTFRTSGEAFSSN